MKAKVRKPNNEMNSKVGGKRLVVEKVRISLKRMRLPSNKLKNTLKQRRK